MPAPTASVTARRIRGRRRGYSVLRPFARRPAAGAADRFVDRRPAGAEHPDRRNRRVHGAGAGPDHPAHAADLHHGAGRTSCSRQRPVRARGRTRRDGASPAASMWRPAAATCGSCADAKARRSRSATIRRSISASRRWIRCCLRRRTVWGPRGLALVLTGMGSDGTRGAAEIVAAGGSVIAQDEATSVVWGMPRSVAQAGLCSAVLPLHQIAAKINRLFAGERL